MSRKNPSDNRRRCKIPKGMIVFGWDAKAGMTELGAFPPGVAISEPLKLQVFQMHEYTGEAGNISLFNEGTSVVSYSSGPNEGIYIVIVLFADEAPEMFENALLEFSAQIINDRFSKDYSNSLAIQFKKIEEFAKLDHEQYLAIILAQDKKREILEFLRKVGIISRDDLELWMKETYRREFLDLIAVCNPLYLNKIIKSIVFEDKEMIILMQDLTVTRVPPPRKLFLQENRSLLGAKLFRQWMTFCKDFISTYDSAHENVKDLAEILIDPQKYRLIKLLRTKFLEESSLPKSEKTKAPDLTVIKQLLEVNIIVELQGEKGPIYALKSDVVASLFFPQRILDLILRNYQLKSFPNQTLLNHLGEIKDFYLATVLRNKS